MKHLTDADEQYLSATLRAEGLAVAPAGVSLVSRHLDWIIETNETLNLTAVTNPREAVRLHAVDSLMALPEVSDAPEGLLLDIGTGGGIPGLELAIATGRRALLVDSVGKKVRAISGFLLHEHLDSQVSVSAERAEDIAREQGAIAAVVTARAVATLPVLLELAAPLLTIGGRLVALKANVSEDERNRGAAAARKCGFGEAKERSFRLPDGGEQRTILSYTKEAEAAVQLPRRPGMATKRPLA